MRKIRDNLGSASVLRLGRDRLIRLQAHPRTQALAQGFEPLVADLERKIQAQAATLTARKASTARVEHADEVLDNECSGLEMDCLSLVRRDRKSPLYQTLWQKRSLSDLQALPYLDEVREVRSLLRAIEAESGLAPLSRLIPGLEAAATALETEVNGRESLEGALDDANRALRIATDVLRRAYNKMAYQLMDLFDGDKSEVAKFEPPRKSPTPPDKDAARPSAS